MKSKKIGKVERGLGWSREAERRVRRRPVQESQKCLTELRKNRELGCRLSGSAGCQETTQHDWSGASASQTEVTFIPVFLCKLPITPVATVCHNIAHPVEGIL